MQKIRLYSFGVVLLIWGVLWFLPWQAWLGGNIWLKFGISLAILIIPGALLYRLLVKGMTQGIDLLVFGFVISHLLLALMGTAGRWLHVSFALISTLFMALGTILLTVSMLLGERQPQRTFPGKLDFRSLLALLPLTLALLLAALMTIQRLLSEDDLAYLAYITHWQHMPALDFKDVYFGADQLTMTRMWLVSTPFSQAFLSGMSGLHGILILTGYYEPFLAVLAGLAGWRLARILGFSAKAASYSVIAQIVFLALLSDYLHPGSPFFTQLSTDKATAAFIFAPLFIQSLVVFLSGPGLRSFILCFLVGLSLSLMHPVIAAFSVLIGGGIVLFSLTRDNLKPLLMYGLLGVMILFPFIVLRFAATVAQPQIPYDSLSISQADGINNMITMWGQGTFYGFNLAVLQIPPAFLGTSLFIQALIGKGWIVIPIAAALLSFIRWRRGFAPRYILSAFLLCAIAGFPLTGWVLGRFFSAWMLERSTWLFPYGIALTWLLLAVRRSAPISRLLDAAGSKSGKPGRLQPVSIFLLLLWLSAFLVILHVMQVRDLPDFHRLSNTTQRYQQLARVGEYLDALLPDPQIVVASDDLNDFLPALSWKAKVISYRPGDPYYPYFLTAAQRSELQAGRQAIFSEHISPAERLELISRFKVRSLLVRNTGYDIFKPMLQIRPSEFSVKRFGGFILITRN